MSSVLFESRRVSRGKEKRDLFECQGAERRHGVRRENSCFSLLILPRRHTQMQTHVAEMFSESGEARDGAGVCGD